MQTLTRQLIDSDYRDRIVTDRQVARLLNASPAARHGLVNRALKAGELIRIQRGLYVLSDRLRQQPVHPFHVAQHLHPGSHVSLETALSWHGWIPEGVPECASVIAGGRSRSLEHPALGRFTFTPLAMHQRYHLTGVERYVLNAQPALVATPLRALLDLACFRKWTWQGSDWLRHHLRIGEEQLSQIQGGTLQELSSVYRHRRVQTFIEGMQREGFT
ncbi:MAG: type IV toxin-antitoxin system AbiEi family antitoxin domain-containing protein [Pseudohongiellaceae bacterium]